MWKSQAGESKSIELKALRAWRSKFLEQKYTAQLGKLT
jgi:hypothetical protein